mmetsp:Transcript_52362/g.125035  ORF Transcript_52362/g.125035 Transcript_52362/m.125035 type:complete len:218 (-) Transcript_52362:229-882(-)
MGVAKRMIEPESDGEQASGTLLPCRFCERQAEDTCRECKAAVCAVCAESSCVECDSEEALCRDCWAQAMRCDGCDGRLCSRCAEGCIHCGKEVCTECSTTVYIERETKRACLTCHLEMVRRQRLPTPLVEEESQGQAQVESVRRRSRTPIRAQARRAADETPAKHPLQRWLTGSIAETKGDEPSHISGSPGHSATAKNLALENAVADEGPCSYVVSA